MPRPFDLRERSELFACEVVGFCRLVADRGLILRRLAVQLLDLGTSVGANLAEGRGGQSKRDFVAKTYIALKEARETKYWLDVIGKSEPPLQQQASLLSAEASELIAILTVTLKTAQSNPNRGQ